MLVPAGFLILMLFAAIAVDSAGAYLAQRQLTDTLAAAANDAATAGLSNSSYYGHGAVVVDPQSAASVVCAAVAAQGDGDLHSLALEMGVAGPVVTLRGTADVDATFGRIIPHFGTRRISAQVDAEARQRPARPDPSAAPALVPIDC